MKVSEGSNSRTDVTFVASRDISRTGGAVVSGRDLTIAGALSRFAGAKPTPAHAALEWLRTARVEVGVCQIQEAEAARREAFLVFMAHEVWKVMDTSCEAGFDRLFGLSRSQLCRWKKELGLVDENRSRRISEGLLARARGA